MTRRGLQAVVALLSLLPLVFGVMGMVYGIQRFGIAGSANLDSQYRFLSGYYVGLAMLAWWIIPQIERQTAIFKILCMAVFLGGLARILTLQFVGWPDTRMLIVHAAELLFPLLIAWQNAIKVAE